MPESIVTNPATGQQFKVTHPEGASQAQIIAFAQGQSVPFESQEREMEDFSAIDRLKYQFATTEGLTENLGIYLESILPVVGGNIFASKTGHGFYASPTELYGEDYLSLEPEQRRQRIQEVRYAKQVEEYPELTRLTEEGEGTGVAGFTGTLLKAIADPTTLIPVGKTYPAMAALGGLVAGSYEAARGLAEEGKIDPVMTATYGAGGALLTPALAKTMSYIRPGFNNLKSRFNSKRTVKNVEEADALMEDVNSKIMQLQSEGIEDTKLLLAAAERLELNPNKVEEAIVKSVVKLDIPDREVSKAILEMKDGLTTAGNKGHLANRLINTTIRRINNISPALAGRIQNFEFNSSKLAAEYTQRIAPFARLERLLPRDKRIEFTKRLYNSDYEGAAQLAKDTGINTFKVGTLGQRTTSTVDDAISGAKDVLDDLYSYADKAIADDIPYITDYFPRKVTDYMGIRRAYGIAKPDSPFQKQLELKAKMMGKKVSDLTEENEINVLNHWLSGSTRYLPKGKPSFRQARNIEFVEDDVMKNYSGSATDSLTTHINKMVDHVEKYKFFGKNNAAIKVGEELDMDASVGELVKKLRKSGELSLDELPQIQSLLKSRFISGEESPAAILQNTKALINTFALGNPFSATTQLGDMFVNLYRYGGKDAGKAILETLTGKNVTNVQDFGLSKHIATDLADIKGWAKGIQDFALQASGFRAVDRLGKNSLLQAAFNKGTRLSKTKGGVEKLREEWGEVFGKEFDSLVNDLSSGKVTDNVKLLLWNELSGSQPISLSDMPQSYLNVPAGRMFYALKTFTIKQLQLLQDTVMDEARKGNYSQAGKNALLYLGIVGGGNAAVKELRNVMQGREFDMGRVDDHIVDYALATLLTSRYAVDNNLGDGDLLGFVMESVTPPINVLQRTSDDVAKTLKAIRDGEEIDPKSLRSLPVVGRWYYNLFGGGAEEFLEREEDTFDLPLLKRRR